MIFYLNNLEIELLRYMMTIRWMSVRQGFFIDSVLRCSRSTWMSPIFHKIGDACCKRSIRFTNIWYNTTSFNNSDLNYGGMIYVIGAFVQTVNNVILPPTSHLFLLDTRYIVSISLVQWEQQLLFFVCEAMMPYSIEGLQGMLAISWLVMTIVWELPNNHNWMDRWDINTNTNLSWSPDRVKSTLSLQCHKS